LILSNGKPYLSEKYLSDIILSAIMGRHKNLSAILIDLCLSAFKCFYVVFSPFAIVDGRYKKYVEWTN